MRHLLPLCGITHKRRHPSQESAIGQVIWLQQKQVDDFGLVVYRCSFCADWHVGHLPGASHVERAFAQNRAVA